jgi:hypothetical protein
LSLNANEKAKSTKLAFPSKRFSYVTKDCKFGFITSRSSHIFPPSVTVFFSRHDLRSLVHLSFRSEVPNLLHIGQDFGTAISLPHDPTDTKTKDGRFWGGDQLTARSYRYKNKGRAILGRRSAYRTILQIQKQRTGDFGAVISLPHDPTDKKTKDGRFWGGDQLTARSYR